MPRQSASVTGAGRDRATTGRAGNHGIFVDHIGNVWIGGNGPGDSHILKFTKDGKFLMQVGKPNARRGKPNAQGNPTYIGGSNDPANFGRVAKIVVDPKANEAYPRRRLPQQARRHPRWRNRAR